MGVPAAAPAPALQRRTLELRAWVSADMAGELYNSIVKRKQIPGETKRVLSPEGDGEEAELHGLRLRCLR